MAANPSTDLSSAWADQRIWSATANSLKEQIDQARKVGLGLAIAAAVLGVAGAQISAASATVGQGLSALAAISIGLAAIVQRRVSTNEISAWTRARSASEGLKSEIFGYLAGSTEYMVGDRDRRLRQSSESITGSVADLLRYTLSVVPDTKPLPAISDLDSYIDERVNGQVTSYYRPRAALYEARVRRLRAARDALSAVAVVFGALAAAFGLSGLSAWIPVTTTISAALVAHAAASRYDHQVIEFLRTADQLDELRRSRDDRGLTTAQFVDACESVISVENQAWMAKWTTSEPEADAT